MHAARSHSARYFSFISICAATMLMVYSFVYDIHICMSMENVCLFSSNRSQVYIIFVVFVVVGYYCLLLLNVLPSTFWLLTADCFQHIGCCCCHFFLRNFSLQHCLLCVVCCPLLLLLSFSRERVKFANVFMHCSHFFSRSRSHRHEYLFMHVCPYAYIMHS